MAIHGSKVQKLTSLIKKTAQKLVKSPKTVNKELKKLALTLPLMALLIEEVRAAQNKVGIDAMAISGAVFEDEAALAEFIEQQNLDEEQYTELEEELDGILLAQADTPKEEDDDKGAYITRDGGVAGEQGFGSQSGSIAAEEGAQTAAAGADESFELAGFIIPFAPAPFIASGVAVGAVVTGVLNNGTEPPLVVDATGTDLTTSLKDLQRLGIDFVNPAAGENTINLSLGDGATLTNGSAPVLFGDTNLDGVISEAEDAATNVTLTINSAQQLAEIAGVTNLASLGVDNIRLDLPGQASLNTLLADPTLAADLAAIRNSGLTIDTIDMGAATSISQAQAATLLSSGLEFADNDAITLQAAAGTTQLNTSLKDLQKLGVDSVSIAGTSHVALDMGGLSAADITNGNPLPTFNSALNVTLDVANTDQFDLATQVISQLKAANIDNVDIEVTADGQGQYSSALAALSGNADFRNDVTTLAAAGINPGLDFGGKDTVANILFDDVSVANLIEDGLHFAANDNISMQVIAQGEGTHLNSSLKDLQKLGIDAVTVLGTDNVIINSGGISAADLAPGAQLTQFDSDLNVTLSVANSSELNASSALATQLNTANIDNVEVFLAANSQAQFDESFLSVINEANFDTSLETLTNNGISVGFDINGADVSTGITITQTIASAFNELNLHYAANDEVQLDVVASQGEGTHLTTSLKDLQKIGVDTVSLIGGGSDNLIVNLGTSNVADFSPFTPLPFFDEDINVTLDVGTSTAEFGLAADIASVLHATHVDTVKFDLADTGAAGFDNDLLALSQNSAVNQDVAALKANMVAVELDLGGTATMGDLLLTEAQASAFINAGVHFADNDNITLDATGTFVSNNLDALKKLGIDNTDELLQPASLAVATQDISDLSDVITMLNGGVDVLANVRLDPQATWGDLIDTLQDSGLSNVELEATAKVHISDDLSAALYDAGMLHALPEAAIAIDAGDNKVLNTSLKAMADLGVDAVNTDHKVYVELGLKPEDAQTVADLADLFPADVLGNHGAGLVVDQATFDNFNSMAPAAVETLLADLSKLGFTEVDVIGDNAVSAVYEINITAQTPVLSQVALIGTDATNDLAHVFDADILNKPVK